MKIGLLPLYIALYDERTPEIRPRLDDFYNSVACLIEEQGISVIKSSFCRVRHEFEAAIKLFEAEQVDAIVTLHMAYSPSLESCDVLKNTYLPLIIFDTTQTKDFSDHQIPDEISYCHGIHGVMDMCNLLNRTQKNFAICAGYYKDEAVIKKLCGYIKAASCANALNGSLVGSVGENFKGMGDFLISDEDLKENFGVTVVHACREEMAALSQEVTDEEINLEIEKDLQIGEILADFDIKQHEASIKADLTLRKWTQKNNLSAITINFQTVTDAGLPTMPFMETCRLMNRGIGYAGEGDVITASFTGALLSCYPETSFVEIFCPDWEHDSLFISHMGEMNYRVADKKIELFEKEFIFGDGINPIAGTAAFKPGAAIFVNIFKSHDGFKLFLSPVTVLKESTNNFAGNIRGWIKPSMPVSQFLEQLSIAGATHHSILVYNVSVEELSFFANCLDVRPVVINSESK